MIKAVIDYKNGHMDWIDPIVDLAVDGEDNIVEIYNGFHHYTLDMNEVKEIRISKDVK